MEKIKPKIWLDVLLIVAAGALGCFLVLVLPRWFPAMPVIPGDVAPVTYNTEVQQGRLPGYKDAAVNTTPEYFWYLYNSTVSFSDPAAPGNVLLENTPGNTCSMVVTYTLATGEEIYRSPTLLPGEYLEYDRLTAPPAAGTYPVTVTILVYSLPGVGTATDISTATDAATPTDAVLPAVEEPLATYTENATITIG